MKRTQATAALETIAAGFFWAGSTLAGSGFVLFCWAVNLWMRAHLAAQIELAELWMPRSAVLFFIGLFLFGPSYFAAELARHTRHPKPRA